MTKLSLFDGTLSRLLWGPSPYQTISPPQLRWLKNCLYEYLRLSSTLGKSWESYGHCYLSRSFHEQLQNFDDAIFFRSGSQLETWEKNPEIIQVRFIDINKDKRWLTLAVIRILSLFGLACLPIASIGRVYGNYKASVFPSSSAAF